MTATGLAALRRSQTELHRLERLAGATAGSIEATLGGGERTIADVDQLLQRLEGRLSLLRVPQADQVEVAPPAVPEPAPGTARPPRPQLLGLALALLRPGDNVVDVGAGGGDFSFGVAARGCAVLAIEASPGGAAALVDRRWRTGFHDLHLVAAPYDLARVDDLLVAFQWATAALVRLDAGNQTDAALDGMPGLLASAPAPSLLATGDATAIAPLTRRGFTVFRIEPHRLVSAEPEGEGDWLAVNGPLPALPGWAVVA